MSEECVVMRSDRIEAYRFWWQAVQQYGCKLMDRTPRLESVRVEKKAIRRWIVAHRAKQTQRLANRMKAADCIAPRGEESAATNERMRRHGVVEGAVLCVLELAEIDEALVMSARREPRRRSKCV